MERLRYRKVTDLPRGTKIMWGLDLDPYILAEEPVFFATTFDYLLMTTSSFPLPSSRMQSATQCILHAHRTAGRTGSHLI